MDAVPSDAPPSLLALELSSISTKHTRRLCGPAVLSASASSPALCSLPEYRTLLPFGRPPVASSFFLAVFLSVLST